MTSESGGKDELSRGQFKKAYRLVITAHWHVKSKKRWAYYQGTHLAHKANSSFGLLLCSSYKTNSILFFVYSAATRENRGSGFKATYLSLLNHSSHQLIQLSDLSSLHSRHRTTHPLTERQPLGNQNTFNK